MTEDVAASPTARLSSGRLAWWTIVIVGVLTGLYTLYLLRGVLFLLLIAILLATAIEPLVFRMRRGPFSHAQGILIVYTGIMLAIAAIVALTVPIILREAGTFNEVYPRVLENMRGFLASIDDKVLAPAVDGVIAQAAAPSDSAAGGAAALTVGLGIVEALFAGLTVFVVAFYWLSERVTIKRAFTGLFPRRTRRQVGTIWGEVEDVMGAWVRGQLVLMLFVGVISAIGYSLMGLRYALVLAVIAGLLEVVPVVGPYLGAVPALLVALTQDIRLTLFVAVFILILQVVESNVLVPRVMEKAVGVSALTVTLGILIGASLGGIAGALVAVPIAAAAQVVLRNLLDDDDELAPVAALVPRPGA